MSALRSSPWSSDQAPQVQTVKSSAALEESDSRSQLAAEAAWCSEASSSVWTLVACDGKEQRTIFHTVPAGTTMECQATSTRGSPAATTARAVADTAATPATDPKSMESAEVAASLMCVALIVLLLKKLVELRHRAPPPLQPQQSKQSRCTVVDVFRGLTICLMVFVNYGGGGFALFQHSVWDGFTIADVVFPWFAWIMGFTMHLSVAGRRSKPTAWLRVCGRASKLFLLGLFLNNGSNWADWRIPGVLQSLAVAYLAVMSLTGLVAVLFPRVGPERPYLFTSLHLLGGVAPLVAVNLALTFALHVPGCPTGYLGPGGDSDAGAYRDCTGGAHLHVDRVVFGAAHIYQTPTCEQAFHTGPFDPEGLLNWLMVAATTYLGFLAGALFSTRREPQTTPAVKTFVWVGGVLLVLAVAISGGFGLVAAHGIIPVNKNLWSLSYVLLSVALAHGNFALVLLCSVQPTATKWLQFATWIHVGRNSIFIYVMHEVFQSFAPFAVKPASADHTKPTTHLSHVVVGLHNAAAILWWIVVAEWMHVHGIFLSV